MLFPCFLAWSLVPVLDLTSSTFSGPSDIVDLRWAVVPHYCKLAACLSPEAVKWSAAAICVLRDAMRTEW